MKATLRVLFALGFIAGFADTATFVHLSGLFSSHVTGNFVMLAASFTKGASDGEWLKIIAVPVFVAAVFAATLIHDGLRGDERERALDNLLSSAAGVLLLIGAAVAYIYGRRVTSPEFTTGDAVAGMIAVMAMGVQNAIHRFAAPLGPTTTVMTGNVTQLTVIASRRILKGRLSPEKPPARPFSLAGMTGLAVAFGAGCAISALLTLALGLVSLAAPGILLIVISFWDRES
jgi:uncharacterized membrane protein YoaK (UPF0700 family)